jgi:hypothetical protein
MGYSTIYLKLLLLLRASSIWLLLLSFNGLMEKLLLSFFPLDYSWHFKREPFFWSLERNLISLLYDLYFFSLLLYSPSIYSLSSFIFTILAIAFHVVPVLLLIVDIDLLL